MSGTVPGESAHDQLIIFKGATYQLSPLTIFLSLVVISHNSIIIMDYYKDRTKFVPSLFMGIALSDMLYAQGLLVMSIISILVYNEVIGEDVLYRSLYYMMVTGLPGYTCSRLFNCVLSLTLTVHLLKPFSRFRSTRLKVSILVLAVILSLLHVSDMVFAVTYMKFFEEVNREPFVELALVCNIPGLITVAALYCKPSDGNPDHSPCNGPHVLQLLPAGIFIIQYILPPLLILVCMVIQVVCLRRDLKDSPPAMINSSRHASITILITSLLFFTCHIALLTSLVTWYFVIGIFNQDKAKKPSLIHQGNMGGLLDYGLPLFYGAIYPIILVVRKPELRERYKDFYRKIWHWFSVAGEH